MTSRRTGSMMSRCLPLYLACCTLLVVTLLPQGVHTKKKVSSREEYECAEMIRAVGCEMIANEMFLPENEHILKLYKKKSGKCCKVHKKLMELDTVVVNADDGDDSPPQQISFCGPGFCNKRRKNVMKGNRNKDE